MKSLFDQGTPLPLARYLIGHTVQSCRDLGCSSFRNRQLLAAAEQAGFDAFVTTDQSLKYQQQLSGRQIANVVLLSTSWPRMQLVLPRIVQAIAAVTAGDYVEIPI